jgi:hypothetical protein
LIDLTKLRNQPTFNPKRNWDDAANWTSGDKKVVVSTDLLIEGALLIWLYAFKTFRL